MASKLAYLSVLATLANVHLAVGAPVEETSKLAPEAADPTTEKVLERSTRKSWMKFPQGMQWANLAWEFKRDDIRSADVVSVDLFDTEEWEVKQHQKKGRAVICYLSAGTLEWWRPDADDIPSDVLALPWQSTGSERWFDVSKWEKLKPVIESRLNMASSKGCDAVEYDNIDCYGNKCVRGKDKWDLRPHQVDYARWLAKEAHDRGLAAGFKNAVDLIDELLWEYDFAINESCSRFNECWYYNAFKNAGKAVFGVEYKATGRACANASRYGISMKVDMGSSWKNC